MESRKKGTEKAFEYSKNELQIQEKDFFLIFSILLLQEISIFFLFF